MTADAFDLCKATFGKIPAGWQRDLEALERSSTPRELEEAFSRAKANGAKHLNYVHETLRAMRAEAPAIQEREIDKAVCDDCHLPKWLDGMTVKATPEGSLGLCHDCAEHRPTVQGWKLTLGGETIYAPAFSKAGIIVRDFWAKRGISVA